MYEFLDPNILATVRDTRTFTSEVRQAVFLRDGAFCHINRIPIPAGGIMTVDHLIPHSFGGATNDLRNLAVAEFNANCNRSNSLDLLVDRKMGFGYNAEGFKVIDPNKRLVKSGGLYYNVQGFTLDNITNGVGNAVVFAVAIEGGIQVYQIITGGPVTTKRVAQAGGAIARVGTKAGAAVVAKNLAVIGLGVSAPAAPVAAVALVGYAAGSMAAETVESGIKLIQGDIDLVKAGTNIVSAPVSTAVDLGKLAHKGGRNIYRLTGFAHNDNKRRKARRAYRRKVRSINFVPDLRAS